MNDEVPSMAVCLAPFLCQLRHRIPACVSENLHIVRLRILRSLRNASICSFVVNLTSQHQVSQKRS